MVATTTPGHAQDRLWGSVGLGIGVFGGAESALAGTLGVTVQRDRTLFRVRAAGVEEVFEDSLLEITGLVGRAYRENGYFGALSAGLGYVRVRRSGGLFSDDPDATVGTIGLSMGAQLYRQPVRFGGIGLDGFMNVNSEASVVGITLGLQFGNVQ
jgi:hypothetical protein